MKPLLPFVIAFLSLWSPAMAQSVETTVPPAAIPTVWDELTTHDSDNLNDFLWHKRLIVVFADTAEDPRFDQQITLLQKRPEDLAERDVAVLTDTDPAAMGPLRISLRPRGFMVVIVGKDGEVYLRKATPWTVRELTRVIDKTPVRQREVRERRQP